MQSQRVPMSQEGDQRPWTVIVRDGRVMTRYRAEETYATTQASIPPSFCGDDLEVWEVDMRLPEPPPEGEPVDPVELGWTSVSRRVCGNDRSGGLVE
jgi:hypothetical protein